MAADPLFVVFLLTCLMLFSLAQQQGHNESCVDPFMCGKLGEISYPFKNLWGRPPDECGLYTVDCSDWKNPKFQLKGGGHWYGVQQISQAGSITINDPTLQKKLKSRRCESLESFGLPRPDWFSNVSSPNIVSLFKCKRSSLHNITSPTSDFQYSTTCGDYYLYYSISSDPRRLLDSSSFPNFPQDNCSFIQLPAAKNPANPNDFFSFFTAEFPLEVTVLYGCIPCYKEKRRCLHDKKQSHHCAPKGNRGSWKLKLGIGLAALSVGLLVLVVCLMRRCSSNRYIFFRRKPNLAQQNVEAFLKIHGPLPTRRYSYLDVKKMTNSFTNKIGQGGYGSVYKGKLQNGCPVAVKVLKQSKGNGEEFINEVATIVRTSHVNIVALLGFCVEGSKRALIYEFMCNGSLERFIFKENHYQKENHQLEWGTLYMISLGIARGLEYLHRGCNTRILHFDIKPHNILLDKDFSPKISDFGLAKVCTREESIISMLEARGTIGYIAPEVFCRSFGGVSYKSDVYSFGMMVLEMIGGRKNVDIGADHTSEIYFPHWIYKRLELDDELGLKGIRNQEDNAKVRKMVTMGLWCIQTDPSNRPTMSKVIEMLEGSVDSLQVPPKPFLSSPSRLPTDSSTSLIQAWSHGSDVANT
ncbi:rust resistance kinase Lr10-like isoform X2 [Ziziphus jujuba]|uniref:Rust resistance kinase Lr10-like isoform X2 n=1 Tax=Ziziphus jujuba TaxID=326968 RepID=A0ABM3ZXX7_ZIZJJ|nr:rust resistance kinase Lr10-like isoform X2 [Ziziphus jujuba]